MNSADNDLSLTFVPPQPSPAPSTARTWMLLAVVVGLLTTCAGLAALSHDRLLYVAGLSEGELVMWGVALTALSLGALALSRSIEVSRTFLLRDSSKIVSTVFLVLCAWFIVGLPVLLVVAFAGGAAYTRLPDVPEHKGVVVRESTSWDGDSTTTVYRGDEPFFTAVLTTMPATTFGYAPIAAGEYTLVERDGLLVLSYPQSVHIDDYGAVVVLPSPPGKL
jgi:hypothetical protein